jgi:hypothetical protein
VTAVVVVMALLPAWRTTGFYFHDDMQTQYVPAIVEMGRAARHGRLALLSDYSWFGGALAGEYQHGVFSLFHVLLCAAVAGLSLPMIATVVSVTYYALAGAGAYRAARVLAFPRSLACAVALVASLNGFNVTWGSWLPAITAWAWLMWLWWALERLRLRAEPRWTDVGLAALFAYLVLASGWHFADLLLVPLVLAVALRGPRPPSLSAWVRRTLLGPALGACLALPALLCFIEYARAGGRTDFDGVSSTWTVPWQALTGLLVPLSTSPWSAFGTDTVLPNVAMAGGVLPVIVLLAALAAPAGAPRRSYVALLVAAGIVLAWSMLPSFGRVRWPFRWLPVAHLLLVVAAGRVLMLEAESSSAEPQPARARASFRRQLIVALAGAALIALSLAIGGVDANGVACAVCGFVALSGLPFAAARGLDLGAAFCAGIALNLIAAPLVLPERTATPTWSSDRCAERWAKEDRSARYLGVYVIWDIIDRVDPSIGRDACILPGNSSMVPRLIFVNGYSTLYPAGLHRRLGLEVHGDLNGHGLMDVTGPLAAPGGLLERWGIDGLVLPSEPYLGFVEERLTSAGFFPARNLGEARIFRRERARGTSPVIEALRRVDVEASNVSGALPPAPLESRRPPEVWTFDRALGAEPATAHDVELAELDVALGAVGTTRVEADVHVRGFGARPALVLLRRPWLPGYRATLGGKPVTVGRLDDTLVGVVVPAGGAGRLVIEYLPLGLRVPALLVVVSALVVLGAGMLRDASARGRVSRRR